ncbi:MAG: cardiolipin synthase [Muribaculaceae bacterium]|nr:cardiolipin synthase [Roseburia sp.]MCM1430996.1 cardiolipin synthase [Muribaculaceae bacterium]MCM1493770.1 cardiolipin synthase [Muribaculaceae bacterium]
MKRFANKIFGKLPLGILIICLQFFWLVYIVYNATAANSFVNIIFEIFAVILCLHIANKGIRTSYKLSWIFLILLLPVFGIPAYYLFGRPELTKGARKKMERVAQAFLPLRRENPAVKDALYQEDFYAGKQSAYITEYAGYPLYYEKETEYFPSGEAVFPRLLEDLRSAERFIFLEYFIIEPGKMFDSVLGILEEKVKSGVLVRLIYDDVGCIQTLPPKFDRILKEKGIECACFNPFRPVMSVVMNNRDHRKIAVVDGRVAYTGGFNLADEYINEKTRFGYWKDAGLRVTGACVWSFTTMFLEMWSYVTGCGEENYDRYRRSGAQAHTAGQAAHSLSSAGFVQPYSDSPMDYEYVGENVYLNLINHAKKYVYVFTPYLILDTEMTTALINAAKSGVDVRILVPGIPDKKLVYMLTQSNFSALIQGGVNIYKYTPGFLHSKCFVVDDLYAVVGTINLDYRSLCLHFECGVFMYRTSAVPQVKADILAAMEVSREVTAEEAGKRLFIMRQFFGVLNLLAPLL